MLSVHENTMSPLNQLDGNMTGALHEVHKACATFTGSAAGRGV